MKKYYTIMLIFIMTFFTRHALALDIGDKAPLFESPSTHGNVILAEFQGKKNVVLALYYADFTPV
jgi:peroxiredoxin